MINNRSEFSSVFLLLSRSYCLFLCLFLFSVWFSIFISLEILLWTWLDVIFIIVFVRFHCRWRFYLYIRFTLFLSATLYVFCITWVATWAQDDNDDGDDDSVYTLRVVKAFSRAYKNTTSLVHSPFAPLLFLPYLQSLPLVLKMAAPSQSEIMKGLSQCWMPLQAQSQTLFHHLRLWASSGFCL